MLIVTHIEPARSALPKAVKLHEALARNQPLLAGVDTTPARKLKLSLLFGKRGVRKLGEAAKPTRQPR